MKNDSIRLHKEHGLNPTIPTCWICGESRNEVALLGAAYKEKAPMHMLMDQVPCEKCHSIMEQGLMLIEVKDNTDQENPYRTGYITAVALPAAKNLVKALKMNIDLKKSRLCFVEESVLKQIMGDMYKKEIPLTTKTED